VAIRIVELLNSVLPAVSIANDTDYGLAAAIYTGDSERAFRVARRLDVGMVLINNYQRGGLTCAGFWHGTGPTGCRLGQRASRAG